MTLANRVIIEPPVVLLDCFISGDDIDKRLLLKI